MKHMIKTAIASGVFDSQDILWLLYHANHALVSLVTTADRAGVGVGDITAGRAQRDFLLDCEYRVGEETGLLPGSAQQVKGQTLGTLGPNTG